MKNHFKSLISWFKILHLIKIELLVQFKAQLTCLGSSSVTEPNDTHRDKV